MPSFQESVKVSPLFNSKTKQAYSPNTLIQPNSFDTALSDLHPNVNFINNLCKLNELSKNSNYLNSDVEFNFSNNDINSGSSGFSRTNLSSNFFNVNESDFVCLSDVSKNLSKNSFSFNTLSSPLKLDPSHSNPSSSLCSMSDFSSSITRMNELNDSYSIVPSNGDSFQLPYGSNPNISLNLPPNLNSLSQLPYHYPSFDFSPNMFYNKASGVSTATATGLKSPHRDKFPKEFLESGRDFQLKSLPLQASQNSLPVIKNGFANFPHRNTSCKDQVFNNSFCGKIGAKVNNGVPVRFSSSSADGNFNQLAGFKDSHLPLRYFKCLWSI